MHMDSQFYLLIGLELQAPSHFWDFLRSGIHLGYNTFKYSSWSSQECLGKKSLAPQQESQEVDWQLPITCAGISKAFLNKVNKLSHCVCVCVCVCAWERERDWDHLPLSTGKTALSSDTVLLSSLPVSCLFCYQRACHYQSPHLQFTISNLSSEDADDQGCLKRA